MSSWSWVARRLVATAARAHDAAWTSCGLRSIYSASSPDVQVVALPKLSHQMNAGRLVKWHKQAGDAIQMYDIIMELETDDLVEEVFKVGDFAGTVTLLVESQEEGYLGEILVKESSSPIPVGTPVATFVENLESLDEMGKSGGYLCPTTDVYDMSQPSVKVLPWQSFLKSGSRQVKCMG